MVVVSGPKARSAREPPFIFPSQSTGRAAAALGRRPRITQEFKGSTSLRPAVTKYEEVTAISLHKDVTVRNAGVTRQDAFAVGVALWRGRVKFVRIDPPARAVRIASIDQLHSTRRPMRCRVDAIQRQPKVTHDRWTLFGQDW